HDAWIALLLSAVSWGIPVSRPLINYRLHSQQQIGIGPQGWQARVRHARSLSAEDYRRVADEASAAADRLEQIENGSLGDCVAALRRKARHFQHRSLALAGGFAGWIRM